MNELIIEAKLENINAVLDFVDERINDCSQKIQNHIRIAVDEIFSNIAHYAYHPEVGGVTVRVVVNENITIEFEDSGAAYDPLSAENPNIKQTAEEREIGGLGIFMVKNLMDSVKYRREGNKNVLTIQKRLT